MEYPFFSVPPVGTITVVFPAFIASRVSSHVNSSMNTVSGACVGVLLAGAVVIVAGTARSASPSPSGTAPASAFWSGRGFGLLARDGAGRQPLDLCERVVDLDLQQRLADLRGRLRLVVAADAVVLVVVTGGAGPP